MIYSMDECVYYIMYYMGGVYYMTYYMRPGAFNKLYYGVGREVLYDIYFMEMTSALCDILYGRE